MPKTTADKNAFDAYRIMYYPVFDDFSSLRTALCEDVSDTAMKMALTMQSELSHGSPYRMTDADAASLAIVYQTLMDSGSTSIPDVAADVASFMPGGDRFKPMYPDFPSQVLEIDEEAFRAHQALHYASTYGVELMLGSLGYEGSVSSGWMPIMNEAEKVAGDVVSTPEQYLKLIFVREGMEEMLKGELSKNVRMAPAATALAADLFAGAYVEERIPVGFHENMLAICSAASEKTSSELANIVKAFSQHPGDVFRIARRIMSDNRTAVDASENANWRRDYLCPPKPKAGHLKTRQKKALCLAFEEFEEKSIASNLADGGKEYALAAAALSPARFAGPRLSRALELVESGKVVSWNSSLESRWAAYEEADGDGEEARMAAAKELLSFYGSRPGVLLRSITRLLKHGVPEWMVLEELQAHSNDYAAPTLARLTAIAMAEPAPHAKNWAGAYVESEEERERKDKMHEMLHRSGTVFAKLLGAKLAGKDTPLHGKKVFVDSCGFSLLGSVVMPNEEGSTSDAYPPSGMAYELPDAEVVRFFTFWDDRRKRVDVDLHARAQKKDGSDYAIGWNDGFRHRGHIVFSGDITTSEDSAEYIDVSCAKALADGVSHVNVSLHLYCGANDWSGIDTCFCGVLPVGNTAPDVKLYNSENVLFHDTLDGDGREMSYAVLDLERHCIRIDRTPVNVARPFVRTGFTLGSYIDLLLASQGAESVDNADEADVVLSVGRSNDDDAVHLIDEGFFL